MEQQQKIDENNHGNIITFEEQDNAANNKNHTFGEQIEEIIQEKFDFEKSEYPTLVDVTTAEAGIQEDIQIDIEMMGS